MGNGAYPASWYAATRDASADRPPLAGRALAALQKLSSPMAKVIHDNFGIVNG